MLFDTNDTDGIRQSTKKDTFNKPQSIEVKFTEPQTRQNNTEAQTRELNRDPNMKRKATLVVKDYTRQNNTGRI